MTEEFDEEHATFDKGVIDPEREIEITKSGIADGLHTGVITKVVYRDEPYQYADIYIKVDNTDEFELKVGYPARISEGTAFGRLLERFGVDISSVGSKIKPYNALVTKKCKFQTITEVVKTDKKTLNVARVIKESLKPM